MDRKFHVESPTMTPRRVERCRPGHLIAEVGRNTTGHCKACAREYARRYYATHAERLRPEHTQRSRLDRSVLRDANRQSSGARRR